MTTRGEGWRDDKVVSVGALSDAHAQNDEAEKAGALPKRLRMAFIAFGDYYFSKRLISP